MQVYLILEDVSFSILWKAILWQLYVLILGQNTSMPFSLLPFLWAFVALTCANDLSGMTSLAAPHWVQCAGCGVWRPCLCDWRPGYWRSYSRWHTVRVSHILERQYWMTSKALKPTVNRWVQITSIKFPRACYLASVWTDLFHIPPNFIWAK